MLRAMASPFNLDWADVDPKRQRFNATLEAVAARAKPHVPFRDGKRGGWEKDVSAAFEKAFGRWACGWCWTAGEGTIAGGPVHAWCCAGHSYTNQDETALRCAAGLLEWRAWIVGLDTTFIELATPSLTEEALRHALPTLIAKVAEATSAADAWYNHAQQVLTWFLEHRGADPKRAGRAVRSATSGIWASWTEPSDAQLENVVPELARVAARQIK